MQLEQGHKLFAWRNKSYSFSQFSKDSREGIACLLAEFFSESVDKLSAGKWRSPRFTDCSFYNLICKYEEDKKH